jgi:hypothetical protein
MDAEALASPRLYALSIDAAGERVRLVSLDEAAYRAASFLDERLLPTAGLGEWVSLDDLRRAMRFADAECDFIFHIGHVGSTLLSRVLGEDDRVFAVREPAILRVLAVTALGPQDPAVLRDQTGLFLKLWARVYRPTQRTLLKATSFVSDIAPLMMTLNPSASAILMFDPPSVHLAAILAGEASRAELRSYASMRLTRLHRRLGGQFWRLDALSMGEIAAMGWACETLALAHLAQQFPDRILWLGFDAFLAQPGVGLSAVLHRLHGRAPPDRIETLLRSPHFGRYAKATEHAFDGELRHKILAQAAHDHGEELARGLAWLDIAGADHPVIGDAVGRIAELLGDA